ncbi:Crp/Fnr family transcriptional regulator [Psychroflexus sp. MES1-P1E]|uniref:Crp/Fnr family transcriptional regulator n=1 Tax=Psychroflexus sp. MES1-P1E TaxID=2058320 RepID=UPI0011AE4068|nr:Crp/Fnr family transcriptional regulator [Psychroflexus sp. MES1-P1E]
MAVYDVRNGISKLSKLSGKGKDQIVKVAGKDEVLGQRSLITSEHTNLSATALSDMDLYYIPKHHIQGSLMQKPVFTNAALKQIATELKTADHSIVNMAQKNMRQRLPEDLLYLDDNFGTDDEDFLYLQFSNFWGMLTVGYLLDLLLLKFIDSHKVLIMAIVSSIICLILALTGTSTIALIAFPLFGLFILVMWSIIFSLALNSVK